MGFIVYLLCLDKAMYPTMQIMRTSTVTPYFKN